jgi:hypothetical protein
MMSVKNEQYAVIELIAIEFTGNHRYHQFLSDNKSEAVVKMWFLRQDAKLCHNRLVILFEHYQRCVGCRGNYVEKQSCKIIE